MATTKKRTAKKTTARRPAPKWLTALRRQMVNAPCRSAWTWMKTQRSAVAAWNNCPDPYWLLWALNQKLRVLEQFSYAFGSSLYDTKVDARINKIEKGIRRTEALVDKAFDRMIQDRHQHRIENYCALAERCIYCAGLTKEQVGELLEIIYSRHTRPDLAAIKQEEIKLQKEKQKEVENAWNG